jgi:hypothetical protein
MHAMGLPEPTPDISGVAYWLLVTEIVMMLDETGEQRFVGCSSDLLKRIGRMSVSAPASGVISIRMGCGLVL